MHSERQERLELPTLRPQWLLRVLLAPGALPHTAPGRVRIGIQRLWPNVLALLESWAFDLGSQVGCRAAGVGVHTTYTLAVSGKDATVAIEGPVPDWTIPAGHRTEDGSTMGAVQCSTLAPPFCSCTGGSAELLTLDVRLPDLPDLRQQTAWPDASNAACLTHPDIRRAAFTRSFFWRRSSVRTLRHTQGCDTAPGFHER